MTSDEGGFGEGGKKKKRAARLGGYGRSGEIRVNRHKESREKEWQSGSKLSVHRIEQWSCFLQRGSPSRVVDWRFRDNPPKPRLLNFVALDRSSAQPTFFPPRNLRSDGMKATRELSRTKGVFNWR